MERRYEKAKKERKHYTAEEKVAILRRRLLDKVPVSDLCEELSLKPTVFYRWQKEFFENGAAAFQAQERPHRQVEEKQKRIECLEKKVQTKDEVLAELMAEHFGWTLFSALCCCRATTKHRHFRCCLAGHRQLDLPSSYLI
jgi:transposase